MNPSNDNKFNIAIARSTAAAATTSTSATIDTYEANWATIVVDVSTEANTNATGVILTLEHDDTTNYASAATVAANVTVDNTKSAYHVYQVDMTGKKRYLRLTVTPDTTTNGAVTYGATYTLQRLKDGPTSTTAMTVTDTTVTGTVTVA